jgi:hypothetical protein
MKEMTSTLMAHIDEKLGQGDVPPKNRKVDQDASRPRGDHEKLKKKKFYAVVNGRNNTNRVFTEWIGGAQDYVTNVKGACVDRYDDLDEAWAQVDRHVAAQAEFALAKEVLRISQSQGEGQAMGGLLQAAAPPKPCYPPLTLLGADPSAKKDDEVFGIDIGSEIGLREKLCPPGLTREQAKAMADGLADVVSLPGGFTSGSEDGGGEMERMSSALAELVRQGRTETDCTTKSDLNWKSDGRTALKTIKSLALLMKRCKVLSAARDRVVKNTIRHAQNILERAGWDDPALIEAWATNGFTARLVRSSLDSWIALHQHLLVLTLTDNMPWGYVQVEIDHHVEELQIIRTTHDSRLQALCGIYAYLRDGHASSWHSTALQYKRNTQVFAQVGRGDDANLSDLAGDFTGCSHCATSLHQGDKLSCPWKNVSKTMARKKGGNALRLLAEGGSSTPETTP